MRNVEKRCCSACRAGPGGNTRACFGKGKSSCNGRFTGSIWITFFSALAGRFSTPSSATFLPGENPDEICRVVRAALVCRRRTGGGCCQPEGADPFLDHDSPRPDRHLGGRLLGVHDSSDPSSKRAVRGGRSQKGESFSAAVCLARRSGRGAGLAGR